MSRTTAAETLVEQSRSEQTENAKNAGVKHDVMEANMKELNRDLQSMVLAKCEGEAFSKVNCLRDGEGICAYIKRSRRRRFKGRRRIERGPCNHWYQRTGSEKLRKEMQDTNTHLMLITPPP